MKVSGSKVHLFYQNAEVYAQELMDQGRLGRARPLAPGEKLYVEIDGGMLQIDEEWHETKLAIAFPQNSMGPISKDSGPISHRQGFCTLDKPEKVGKRLYKISARFR